VDWESAAIAPGEIDLAALTERWAPEFAARAERAYVRSRWPGGSPQVFETTLAAARIYLYLRWLGDSRQTTLDERSRWRFDDLRALCERAELL
jgi:thiamine kinase-like enzyme